MNADRDEAIEAEARKLCEAAGLNGDLLVHRAKPSKIGTPGGCVFYIAPKPENVVPLWSRFRDMAITLREMKTETEQA